MGLYASREKKEACFPIEDWEERRACEDDANTKAIPASCKAVANVDETEKVERKEEATREVLGAECDKSADECFEERKEKYKKETGKADISNTEMRTKLYDVAADKAQEAMAFCSEKIDWTNAATKMLNVKNVLIYQKKNLISF